MVRFKVKGEYILCVHFRIKKAKGQKAATHFLILYRIQRLRHSFLQIETQSIFINRRADFLTLFHFNQKPL